MSPEAIWAVSVVVAGVGAILSGVAVGLHIWKKYR